MTKKDFSTITTGRVQSNIAKATGTKGTQGTASEQEQAERAASGRTQGRKGCKKPGRRLNLLLTPDNHDFIQIMARAAGKSMTELTNDIIAAYRNEHPEIMAAANEFLDIINSGKFSKPANKKKKK